MRSYAVFLEQRTMGKTTITFRVDARKKDALDAIAAYLDAHEWQIEHIKKGVRQADAGKFATEKDVNAAMARWRR